MESSLTSNLLARLANEAPPARSNSILARSRCLQTLHLLSRLLTIEPRTFHCGNVTRPESCDCGNSRSPQYAGTLVYDNKIQYPFVITIYQRIQCVTVPCRMD